MTLHMCPEVPCTLTLVDYRDTLMHMQETLKAEAAAEREEIIKQSAESAQHSIMTQQARFEAEMGTMKNRLDHEKVHNSCFCPSALPLKVNIQLQYNVANKYCGYVRHCVSIRWC